MDSVLIAGSRLGANDRLCLALAEEFVVTNGPDGLESLRFLFSGKPQAVLLDATSRVAEIRELVRVIRAASDMAILVLRSEREPHAASLMLEAGADDCVPDSTDSRELVARLRAAIRRSKQQMQVQATDCVTTGALVVNRETREVYLSGVRVSLTPTEFRLLETLAMNVGKPVPHRALLSNVWGAEYIGESHYLRVYMGYLRQKLERNPRAPRYLLNDWGVGYRLAALPPEVDLPAPQEVDRDERILVGA